MDWPTLKRFWHIEVLGGEHKPFNTRRLIRRVLHREQEHYLFWFRVAQYLYRRPAGTFNYPKMARRIHSRLVSTHGIDIMLGAEIGAGLTIPHRTGIVIASAARIGENLFIRQNTTIGVRANGQTGLIHIGNNVELGANVCIIGENLRIGHNVSVGAMAFVNKDIPDNSTCYTRHVATIRHKTPPADGVLPS